MQTAKRKPGRPAPDRESNLDIRNRLIRSCNGITIEPRTKAEDRALMRYIRQHIIEYCRHNYDTEMPVYSLTSLGRELRKVKLS